MLGKIRRFLSDERGTTALEFTIVMMGLFGLTMGIYDFGRATWAYNAAQKATYVGSRTLAVRDPLHLPIKYHFNCDATEPTVAVLGKLCRDENNGSIMAECDFGTVTCTSAGCGSAFDSTEQAVWDDLVTAMQNAYPYLLEDNIQVVYKATNLGFIGKPNGPIAEVTTQITGDTFNFVGLAPFGFTNMSMPVFQTTITSEDFSDNSLLEQGLGGGGGNGGGGNGNGNGNGNGGGNGGAFDPVCS